MDAELPELGKNVRHDVSIVVDRLVMKEGVRRRLSDSVETALSEAHGLLVVDVYEHGSAGGDETGKPTGLLFSENLACPIHGVSLPEMAPRIFSFNSPHGACETCGGLGARREIDPALVVGDGSLSVAEGVLSRGAAATRSSTSRSSGRLPSGMRWMSPRRGGLAAGSQRRLLDRCARRAALRHL